MKRAWELTRVGERVRSNKERLNEISEMPDDKMAKLYSCAAVRKVICEECESETWLIGMPGHNGTDTCHECGAEYKVVG